MAIRLTTDPLVACGDESPSIPDADPTPQVTAFLSDSGLAAQVSLRTSDGDPQGTAGDSSNLEANKWLTTRVRHSGNVKNGDVFTVYVTVTNESQFDFENVYAVVRFLSDNMSLVSADPAPAQGRNGRTFLNIGGLAAYQEKQVSLTLRAEGPGTASIHVDAQSGFSFSDDDGLDILIMPEPEVLSVTMSIVDTHDPVDVGQNIEYTIRVQAQDAPYDGGSLKIEAPLLQSMANGAELQ